MACVLTPPLMLHMLSKLMALLIPDVSEGLKEKQTTHDLRPTSATQTTSRFPERRLFWNAIKSTSYFHITELTKYSSSQCAVCICLQQLSLRSSTIKIPISLRHKILSRQDNSKSSGEVHRGLLVPFLVVPTKPIIRVLQR